MLFYVFHKEKIMEITRLCFGLVLLGGFIPTAQALPLPESYFTPQVFSKMLVTQSFAEHLVGRGEVAGIKFTFDGIRSDNPRSNCWNTKPLGNHYESCYVHSKTFKAVPGSLQASPDPDFTAVDCIPGNTANLCSALVVSSKGVPPQSPGPYSFTTTFTFEKPLPGACHIFVDDVDQYLNAAFRFFDENGVLLDPRNYLVNDISDISLLKAPPPPLKGMPTVTKSLTGILFEGKSGKGYPELTQEIIPDVNTIKKIEFRLFNSKIQSGGVGVYFSCSAPPHIRKAFKPDTIKQGEVSKLEFEIDVFGNPLFEANFIDTLPTGLMVANPNNASTDCGGGSTVSVTRDDITLHNLNLAYKNYDPNLTPDRCTVSVDVTNRPLKENASCTSLPDAFTNKETNFNGDSFNKTGLSACLIVNLNPTAVSIGNVDLQALPAATFLVGLGIEQMDDAAVLTMLEAWDPEAAATLAGADRETILSALQQYLDPDGDGQVAVLAWDTLEERGTIGFYVERQVGEGDWARINNDMLPGLITAPMGGEYQLVDPAATSGNSYHYQLIEQEARGNTRTYGPFTVEMP